jgi:PhnB protein
MSVTTTAHINARGNARELLNFYAKAFDGEVIVATYSDIHAVEEPSQTDQVAWGQVTGPNGFRVMAYDVQPSKPFNRGENAYYIALRGNDTDEIQRMWNGLADEATVLTPLAPAPFAPLYGMLTDRYGVTWIVDATAGQEG